MREIKIIAGCIAFALVMIEFWVLLWILGSMCKP